MDDTFLSVDDLFYMIDSDIASTTPFLGLLRRFRLVRLRTMLSDYLHLDNWEVNVPS